MAAGRQARSSPKSSICFTTSPCSRPAMHVASLDSSRLESGSLTVSACWNGRPIHQALLSACLDALMSPPCRFLAA